MTSAPDDDQPSTTITVEQVRKALLAGSFAGGIEHAIMFPVDTVKTRLQVRSPCGEAFYKGVCDCALRIAREERLGNFYRGLGPVLISAVPSHGLQFGAYEFTKSLLGIRHAKERSLAVNLKTGLAGGAGVAAHDVIVTPLDVVKQRMQMQGSPYKSSLECVKATWREGGLRTFYRSYPITLALNVPFMASYFISYEWFKHFLTNNTEQPETIVHILSGAAAGGVAGCLSNPPDVLKTRIQTSSDTTLSVSSLWKEITRGGVSSLFVGARARMLLFMPSAALSWTAYEWMKNYLMFDLSDVEDILEAID